MSYLDIAFLALVVLFAIVGVWKGFIKSAIGMFGWIVALLIAFFCAKPLAEWLAGGVCKGIVTGDKSLYSFFYGKLPEAVVSLPAGASAEEISAALGSGVFAALIKPFVSLFTSSDFMATSATVGEGVALVLANAVFTLLCGIVLFIVARVLMSLFGRFASSDIDSSRALTAVNRFLGLGFLCGALTGIPIILFENQPAMKLLGAAGIGALGVCALIVAMFAEQEQYKVLKEEPLLFDPEVRSSLMEEYVALKKKATLIAMPSTILFVLGILALVFSIRGIFPWSSLSVLIFLGLGLGLCGFVISLGTIETYEILVKNEQYATRFLFKAKRRIKEKIAKL